MVEEIHVLVASSQLLFVVMVFPVHVFFIQPSVVAPFAVVVLSSVILPRAPGQFVGSLLQ